MTQKHSKVDGGDLWLKIPFIFGIFRSVLRPVDMETAAHSKLFTVSCSEVRLVVDPFPIHLLAKHIFNLH